MIGFEKLEEIGSFLGKELAADRLKQLHELYLSGSIPITIWGHYSAGKSKLINQILGEELLPVQSRETTAALTYIQYGEERGAQVYYQDGRVMQIPVEEVRNFSEHTKAEEICIEKVGHIEISLPNPLLKNGLILVDTPGVNTTIQRHQLLAAQAIRATGKLIYVLGGPVTNEDRDRIQEIENYGIEILFVRTKCDCFRPEEEDAEAALKQEKEELAHILGREICFYAVSNEKQSGKWYEGIGEVRAALQKISQSSEKELKESCERQAEVYAEQFLKELKEKEAQLREMQEGKQQNLNQQITDCQCRIQKIEDGFAQRKAAMQRKLDRSKKESVHLIKETSAEARSKFEKRLEGINSDSKGLEKSAEQYYRQEMKSAAQNLAGALNEKMDVVISEDALDYDSEIPEESLPSYQEIKENGDAQIAACQIKLQELRESVLAKREALDKELSSNKENREEIRREINACEEQIKKLDEGLDSISGITEMKLADEQQVQPSEIMKKLGDAADIMLLFIPVGGTVKGTAAVGKSAAAAAKGAAFVGKGAAAAGQIKNDFKVLRCVDRIRDAGYIMNLTKKAGKAAQISKKTKAALDQMGKNVKNGARELLKIARENYNPSPDVFDMLSVSYWAELIGKQFDTPPRMEIDIEKEAEKREAKKQLRAERNSVQALRLEKQRQANALVNEAEELWKKQCEAEKELHQEEARLEQKSKQNETEAAEQFKKKYLLYFSENTEAFLQHVSSSFFVQAARAMSMYLEQRNKNQIAELQEQKANLEKLQAMGKDVDKLTSEIERCVLYKEELMRA